MDIISIAQQARPNDIGQIELRRAQLTTLSSEAKRMPSSFRKFSSWPGFSSVTPLASSTAILRAAPGHGVHARFPPQAPAYSDILHFGAHDCNGTTWRRPGFGFEGATLYARAGASRPLDDCCAAPHKFAGGTPALRTAQERGAL